MQNNSSKFKIFNFTLLLSAFSFAFYAPAALAAIAKLEFVTPARVVAPGAISEKITIQTQTTDGQSETIGQTADVTFKSSSPTGEFLNESGDPVRATWNSNWANRTFYYRDSNVGNHTLTITVAMREGGPSWTTSQTIIVGQAVAEPPPDPEPEPPPPVVEPPPDLGRQASNGSLASNQSTTLTAPVTTAPPAPASTSTLVASMVAPIPPAGPATDVRAAELARLGNELALAAVKLQTAQTEKPRPAKSEPKTAEPKTLEIDQASLAAAVIEIPKPPGFFERLLVLPRKIWQAIKGLFRRS
ncbi:MAG: hypothetical protein HYT46_03785 [Candidatus Vogelbacteria bacterium]|nr:hypothetical protein [Candidatus Vogelbacteria bacterium]